MSWGFRVSRDSGEVLVDSDHITLAHIYRGPIAEWVAPSVFYGGAGPGAGYYYSDEEFGARFRVKYPAAISSNSPPIVALLPMPNARGCFHAFRNLGEPGNWIGFEVGHHRDMKGWDISGYMGNGKGPYLAHDLTPNWDYAVASVEGCPQSGERYGLRVWDEAGRLVFDSGTPIFRIVRPLINWGPASPRNAGGYVRHMNDWPYGMTGQYGVLASSLAVHVLSVSNIGNTYVSPRIGFSANAPGKVLMTLGGTDNLSYARAAPGDRGWLDDDYRLYDFFNQGGGLQTFAVKVPR